MVFSGIVRHRITTAPIANALVEILSGASAGKGVRTDSTGAFRMEGVVKGQARTRATATNLSDDTATLDFAADTTHTFELRSLD